MAYFSRPIFRASSWMSCAVCSAFIGFAMTPAAVAGTDTAPTGTPKTADSPGAAPAKPDAAKPSPPKAEPAKPAARASEKSRSWKPSPAVKAYEGSAPDASEPPPTPPSGGDERNPGGVEHAPNSGE